MPNAPDAPIAAAAAHAESSGTAQHEMSEATRPALRPATFPFHEGEAWAQQKAGVRKFAEQVGARAIREAMPEQHRRFFSEQPFVILGGIDSAGRPWATIRASKPGFVSSPDAMTLLVRGGQLPGDPLPELKIGAEIGILGIEPRTRRRNRANGVVSAVEGDAFELNVRQSFGNCPKYIQSRLPEPAVRRGCEKPLRQARDLSEEDKSLIRSADTFFIATLAARAIAGAAGGADVSHRGGLPGFVHVEGARTLNVPDYSGNNFFNTLGNIAANARAGLLFIDFETGDLLHVTAHAQIIWDEEVAREFPGARRVLRLTVREARRSPGALPFRWSSPEFAPQFKTEAS